MVCSPVPFACYLRPPPLRPPPPPPDGRDPPPDGRDPPELERDAEPLYEDVPRLEAPRLLDDIEELGVREPL
jgi:hypothetical protein